MEKENKRLKVLLAVLSFFAMGLCGYFAYTVYKLGGTSNKSETNCIKVSGHNLSAEKLSGFSNADFNIIKDENAGDYSFKLLTNGKVSIGFDSYISNITNAEDIILFISGGEDYTLYILTKKGEVYKYNTSSIAKKEYNATKLEEYSDIERMVIYKTRRKDAGGCDKVILVGINEEYYEADSFCV